MPIDYVIEQTEYRRYGQSRLNHDFNIKSEDSARARIYASRRMKKFITEKNIHYIESLQAFALHIIIAEIRSYD